MEISWSWRRRGLKPVSLQKRGVRLCPGRRGLGLTRALAARRPRLCPGLAMCTPPLTDCKTARNRKAWSILILFWLVEFSFYLLAGISSEPSNFYQNFPVSLRFPGSVSRSELAIELGNGIIQNPKVNWSQRQTLYLLQF